MNAPSHWSVFDPDGIWLTTVTMPPSFRIFEIGGDYVLGFTRDDAGVEQVQAHTLSKGGRATESPR